MDLKKRHEYLNFAREIERKYRVRVSVIEKKQSTQKLMPWITTPDNCAIYVIAPQTKLKNILDRIRNEEEKQTLFFEIHGIWPVSEMIKLVQKDKTFLRKWLGGIGPLVPFLFNREIHGNFSKELEIALKKRFGRELDEAIKDRMEAMRKTKQIEKNIDERYEKLLGANEEKELITALEIMAKEIVAKKGNVLIAVDRSGRPLGIILRRILRDIYGKNLPLFFVDPTNIKSGKRLSKANFELFERQFPQLAKALKKGAKPAVVDDKIFSGSSVYAMDRLLRHFGAKKPIINILAGLLGSSPSWRYFNVLGIETAEKSFKTRRQKMKINDIKKMQKFRRKLRKITDIVSKHLRKVRK